MENGSTTIAGWPRFGSVQLRFVHGTVRAVPVSVPTVSSGERASRYFCRVLADRPVPIPVSVPERRFRRFRFLEKRFRRFRFLSKQVTGR